MHLDELTQHFGDQFKGNGTCDVEGKALPHASVYPLQAFQLLTVGASSKHELLSPHYAASQRSALTYWPTWPIWLNFLVNSA
jgi:hypothetical protein